jgi:hypothetical protein
VGTAWPRTGQNKGSWSPEAKPPCGSFPHHHDKPKDLNSSQTAPLVKEEEPVQNMQDVVIDLDGTETKWTVLMRVGLNSRTTVSDQHSVASQRRLKLLSTEAVKAPPPLLEATANK